MANIINATDNKELIEPDFYSTTREFKRTSLNFKLIFKKCVDEVFFTEYDKRKVLDMDITKRSIDRRNLSTEELYLINKFMLGTYNSNQRKKIVELFQQLWEQSGIFREKVGGVIKAIDDSSLIQAKNKTFPYYKNPVKIVGAKDYFRFHLNELYNPIRNYILNVIISEYGCRLYTTDSPFIFEIEETKIIEEYKKVMVGESIYELITQN